MRIAYLDCFAGIAGDMLLGALVGAGVSPDVLHQAVAALGLNATLTIETVDRSGISCIKVDVLDGGELAETKGHTHADGQVHEHGRSLNEIRSLIQGTSLDAAVKALAIRTFDLLGNAEARIHNVAVDEIHFHEVGAVDAIVDIVAGCAGLHHLGIEKWYASAVNVGGGTVECAHGRFPVPAPATADLLRAAPTYSAHIQKELVTPTGAALLRALEPTFGPQPPMRVEAIGYGAGTRNPKGFPNALRLSAGEGSSVRAPMFSMPQESALAGEIQREHAEADLVTVLETAVDDASPQLLAYVAEQALAQGALDVMLAPVMMKKGRPGTLVTVLCKPAESERFERLLLRETSTLGVRVRQDRRVCLARRVVAVATSYGSIRVKLGLENGEERNAAPEFEDCKAAALQHGVPLKLVQQAALLAYRQQQVGVR